MSFADQLRRWLSPSLPGGRALIPPGMYPYVREWDGQGTRLHLRVDDDGSGVLLANATMAARLNASGVTIAKRLLEGESPQSIVEDIERNFRNAPYDLVRNDVNRVQKLIAELASPGDNFPILNLADPALTGSPGPLIRPLSADLPLDDPRRLAPLLDRLWSLGVPHVTYHLLRRPDPAVLLQAIERAEDLGMIAGISAPAELLDQPDLLHSLAMAGIDHINLLYLSVEAEVHDRYLGAGDHARTRRMFAAIEAEEVCPVAEIPLVSDTETALDATLEDLKALRVTNAGCFAIAAHESAPAETNQGALLPDAVVQAAVIMEEAAQAHGLRTLWYPPVLRDRDLSLAAQIRLGPVSSGDHAIRVLPDGSVFPPRGGWQPAGNVLEAGWEALRRAPTFQRYLERVRSGTHCDRCPGLAICAADCPRSPEGWVESWPEPQHSSAGGLP